MQTFLLILDFFGYVSTVIVVVVGIVGIIAWVRGIFPVLFRLGNGLARRKIAIIAKSDNQSSLRSLLLDSRLFRRGNMIEVTKASDFGKAEAATVYLVFWHDWTAEEVDEILRLKKDHYALIVYAPVDQGRIPDDQMKKLDGKRHSAVTNFRGRLLNDVVTAMITTSLN